MKALMIGDIVGPAGIKAVAERLPSLARELGADIIIANGENAADGFGITKEEASALFAAGIDVLTGGNHIWEKKDAAELLDATERLLRPANYPQGAPGHGTVIVEKDGFSFLVMSLQGREWMTPIDCPFRAGRAAADEAARLGAALVVDFHAESAEEKEALALYLDGDVAAFAGTHTHVQTADERVLPKGTGYITDLGMTGPLDSVIGVKTEICVRRSLTQMPIKMESADGPSGIRGVLFEIDPVTRTCLSVRRIAEDL
ncbi:MAG: TIGR00282 family metallophosphoesterase [Spirochaetes bacterium]|nr:TIGR00282 family metallophosphoesterase [Spirochaetota bacterium]